uniref:F-box domain-containing protein n=1 Tax=Panagrolaimus sp. JU765 TaxID=591449 RepID=A0AC34RNS5_9BILA
MTGYFNFLGLPSVVQDLITNEIVHNSIPEDRIQLALTSKYCNELVQHARQKKIIDKFTIGYHSRFSFISNSIEYIKTEEQLTEILPNSQIKQLKFSNGSLFSSEEYLEFLDILFEAAIFATKFGISINYVHKDKVIGFYVKLKHLKSVTVRNPELILPYYPSKTAKFSTGAEIRVRNDFEHVPVYLTSLGQNTFTFEMSSKNSVQILISQKFVGKNKRILKLKKKAFPFEIAFNVVSALNPKKNYFSGVFKEDQRQMLINLEDVDPDEILLVKLVDEIIKERTGTGVIEHFVHSRYSAKMLESAFPTANFTTPEERVEKINNVLGTNIQLFQVYNFAQTVRAALRVCGR